MSKLPLSAKVYLVAVWIAAVLLCFMVLRDGTFSDQIPLLIFFTFIFVLADYFEVSFEIQKGDPIRMTIGDAITMFLISVVSAHGVLVVAMGTALVDILHRRPWYKVLFNLSQRCLTYLAMISVYTVVVSSPEALPFEGVRGLLAFVLVTATYYVLNTFLLSVIIALTSSQSPLRVFIASFHIAYWVHLMVIPLGAILAVLWKNDPSLFLLGLIPLLLAQRSFQAIAGWQEESQRSKALAVRLENLQETATAMIADFEPEPLLETVSTRLAMLLDASANWVILLNHASPRLLAAYHVPEVFQWQPAMLAAELQGSDVRQLDAAALRRLFPDAPAPWQALAVIPLTLDDRVLGGICLATEHPLMLSEDDCRVLRAFAAQTALALEHARLFAEVREQQEELIRSSKLAALGTFSAGIAHEFNNLLAAILGYVQLGLTTDDIAEKNDVLEHAVRACMRGRSITGGLLTFARRGPVQRELHAVNTIVEDTLALVERDLVKHNIRIQRNLKPTSSIYCDPGQLTQVILNLLTNARDSMLDMGGGIITVDLAQRGQYIDLAVHDTGCGIPAEMLDQVFQPFVTTKGAMGGSKTPGTGLGLSISYGIVESHGGTIAIDSTVGQGTTVRLRLPVPAPAAPAATSYAPPRASAAPYVLAVNIGAELVRMLDQQGCTITSFHDHEAALRAYCVQPSDLVLLGAVQPNEQTMSFLQRLRSMDETVQVLIITPQVQHADLLLHAGATQVVQQVGMLEELTAIIRKRVFPALPQAA
jgi:two-component system NtrC family sensor kinase